MKQSSRVFGNILPLDLNIKSVPNIYCKNFMQMQLNLYIVRRKCEWLYMQNWDVENVAVWVVRVFGPVKFEEM